ncbi:MAG: Fic family protein [Desulfobacteraceae bacterium]|nr:Fic family protein [Desulfobacteraceae bacterium]
MATYVWQHPDWPSWRYDAARLATPLARVRHDQGRLIGRMESLGFKLRDEAWLTTLTRDVVKTSQIEGQRLDTEQVRSSIARRLGLDISALAPAARHVDGIVDVMLDATRHYDRPLTGERLCAWHAALFPTGRSGLSKIRVGTWRNDSTGPMQVVSGPVGRPKVHYTAPPADRLKAEIERFLEWFEGTDPLDGVLKAGLAQLWLVTLHPFDDGNGRIARAVGDMALARSEQTVQRFYSLSAQIQKERSDYYDMLDRTQKGKMDVTDWLMWFLECLQRAVSQSREMLAAVLDKARFWERFAASPMNERQIKVLNRLLDGFEGKLTTGKWAKLAKCSQDTAYRDILALMEMGALSKAQGAGRGTHYEIRIDTE